MRSISGLIEDGHSSVKNLTVAIENEIDQIELDPSSSNHRYILRLGRLIRDIDRVKPFQPLGLFSVDRSIMTSMISVAVTYIIVLLQFRLSFND